MFKIILESANNERLESVGKEGNAEYLPQDENEFEMLGDISIFSCDIFASKDMEKLIIELKRLKERLIDIEHANHIDEIIDLAKKCKSIKHSKLIFAPFEE
ncbi:hypothetical protein ACE3MZ_13560 [Paenibacillus sp. WLX1005]|uniref:hypothetical protein n=1 Tax=Paenibacillus sp. WLX1005 TaxID=3243766 RepID=UPI003983F725